MKSTTITTDQAAELLGCTRRRVQQLLNAGLIKGRLCESAIHSGFWEVDRRSVLARVRAMESGAINPRGGWKPNRPRKPKT